MFTLVNAYAAGRQRPGTARGHPGGALHGERRRRLGRADRGALRGERRPGGRNSMFLDALEARFGDADARGVFADLRQANDPEAPVTVPGSFPLPAACREPHRAAWSSTTAASWARRSSRPRWRRTRCSSARSAPRRATRSSSQDRRSATSSRSSSPRWSSPAAGFATRGAVFPGVPFVLIGRGPDFAWSATSSQADNIDLFVETLCDGRPPLRLPGPVHGRCAASSSGRSARRACPTSRSRTTRRRTGRSSAMRPSAASGSRSRCSARPAAARS